jgi:hypothetical protein
LSDEINIGNNFDLSAASWRKGFNDESLMVNALSQRLAQALPRIVKVNYYFSFFSKKKDVRSIDLSFPNISFQLDFAKRYGMQCKISKVVRGVEISSKEIEFSDWIDELSKGLNDYATNNKSNVERMRSFLL